MKWLHLFAAASAGLGALILANGCGAAAQATCVNACEEQQQCPKVDRDLKFVDCSRLCEAAQSDVEAGGCDDKWSQYTDCLASQQNDCQKDDLFEFAEKACKTQLRA